MTHTILIFIHKKPGVPSPEFETIYETKQLPIVREITGEDFPLFRKRGYVQRKTSNHDSENELTDYDCVAELIFENEAHFDRFQKKLGTEEGKKKLKDVEKTFMDVKRTSSVIWGR